MPRRGVIGPPSSTRFAHELERLGVSGKFALAVSGGADSLALLVLAAETRPGHVIAATVDHGLRPEAAGEAARVGAIAARLGVPHFELPVHVAVVRDGIQAAARRARYAALARWARDQAAGAILTAHHADDQAETVLLRLARGAGVAGLAGVRRSRDLGGGLRVARPLLGWRKADLILIVREAGLDPVDDPSNRDPRFDRTAARELLAREPKLDPRRLASVAAHLAEAEEALAWMSERLWRERASGTATIQLDLDGLPPELCRRLLARALPGARGSTAAALLQRLAGVPVATLAGMVVHRDGERLTISPAPPRRRT